MILRLILWVLHLRLRWLARFNEDFKTQLPPQQVIVQIKTQDGKVARYFAFTQGQYDSGKTAEQATATVEIESSAYALALLRQASKQGSNVLMQAMAEQKIQVRGNMMALMQLMPLLQLLPPRSSKAAKA